MPAPEPNLWLKYAPPPRPRPPELEWDVFISYRSASRPWAFALHDTLTEAGFKVFLDQYVLVPGARLDAALDSHLERSASGVLVWTHAASESEWVLAEYDKMKALAKERKDFHFVIAKVDGQKLPFREAQTKYVDFTAYPDGPRGGQLLELMFGLLGQPPSAEAVAAIAALNDEMAEVIRSIRAARDVGDAARLVEIGASERPAVIATPLPLALAAESLIALKKHDEALQVLEVARRHFPRAVRPRQLAGLTYRRKPDLPAAQNVLAELYADGHRDPETLGIYAATWAMRHVQEGKRAHLERSQALYQEAFAITPSDSYVGINAASKLALLGRPEEARALATVVLKLVQDAVDGADYWKTATHAEARLLLGEYAQAAKLYRQAAVRHSEEIGSLQTTRTQLLALMDSLAVPPEERQRLVGSLEVQ